MRQPESGASITPAIRLVRRLGGGGMGSVWVADHLALRTQVVVKFIAVELASNPEALDRFSREAAAAAQVKSPHVVQMLDHGVTPDGVAFIVMELLEGEDLGTYLRARGRLSIAETAEIIGQVCKALGRAHERRIVHRDIKPDNIFLCAMGQGETFVKLLDFGIAKGDASLAGSSGTKTGAMVGTPYYMSPEQITGAKNIDMRTDLWSLGVVVYECVVGARPFVEESFGGLVVRIHSGPIPLPSTVDPTLPPLFDDWFGKACARDPANRFATAKELSDALLRVATGARMSAPPPRSPAAYRVTPDPAGHSVSQQLPGRDAASTVDASSAARPATHPGVGLGTLAPRASGGGWAASAIGLAVALGVLGVGGVLAIKRMGSAPRQIAVSASPADTMGSAPLQHLPPLEPATPPVVAAAVPSSSSAAPASSGAASLPSETGSSPRPPPLSKARPTPRAPAARPASRPTQNQANEQDIF